jgi:broad specificity phosphatase PhoE
MILHLIRHSETEWNVEQRCQGFSDSPLTDTGRRQVEATARHMAGIKVETVYSSTLGRAHSMACAIADYHKVPVRKLDAFRELNQGEFEGLMLTELVDNHPDFLQQWLLDPADAKIPGGESMREVQQRAWSALEKIVKEHDDGNVVVVSHNLCIMALLCRIMKVELANFRRIRQDVAAINTVEFGGRWPHPVVVRLNDTCHLRSE